MYDGEKQKAASDAILERLVATMGNTTPAGVKELAEAFNLLETATKTKS